MRQATAESPVVSVVVPAYNMGGYIAEGLASVLTQSVTNLECIVVDDGSTDATAEVVHSYRDPRVRYVKRANTGTVSDARNLGIECAEADLVAFLDGDDYWLPKKLEKQLAAFHDNPDLGMIYSGYAITDEVLRPRRVILPDRSPFTYRGQVLLEANGIGFSSTAIIPTRILRDLGGFNSQLSVSEDTDMADRIAQRYPVAAVHECLTLYRLHHRQGHRRLDAFEHDVLWLLDDRFGPNGVWDSASWRRGRAHLYTRLTWHHFWGGQVRHAVRHLGTAIAASPRRAFTLPPKALARRASNQWRSWPVRRELVNQLAVEQAKLSTLRRESSVAITSV
jgi:glycosyltransferase involved in cell wall biosynthesis